MMRHPCRGAVWLSCLTFAAAGVVSAGGEQKNASWPSVHGDLNNQRYVAADQINRATITRLGAAWLSDSFEEGETSRMTPLVHEGLMFFAAGSHVYALDARSGKRVWTHQTETRTSNASGWEQMVTGLATSRSWGLGLGGGMVYVSLMNGHVAALREKTGELVWDRLVSTEALTIAKGIICTPLYVTGVLYLGTGIETTEGHALAIDANTGRLLWRVPTIAEPDQPGGETWPKDNGIWRSGGGHPWTAPAADPALGLVYFVTGNASPPFGGRVRLGNNLYTVSIIALELQSGKLRWYRQLIHHDVWEADLSVPPILFDAMVGGRKHRAVAVIRADGYLFTFDRATGEPLIPIDERPVPQKADIFTAPTQPFPHGGESILPPCDSWLPKIPDGFVLSCMFDPLSPDTPNQLGQWASVRIAPMSFDPMTRLFYAQGHNSLLWRRVGNDPYLGDTTIHSGDRIPNYPRPTVVVAAIDSRTGRLAWRKELPAYNESGYQANGGALSTGGGLVFHQGGDGTLQAYDAATGETRWQFQTGSVLSDAPPMSYVLDGRQYVAFIAGTKVWAFALDGKLAEQPPPQPRPLESVTGPIEDTTNIETLTFEQVPANGHRYFANEYAFNPYRARIQAGTAVTFINNGYLPHTITARDGTWTTGLLYPTQVKTLTFPKPGTYLYSAKEYPWSYGQLIVTAAEPISAKSASNFAVTEQVALGKSTYLKACEVCHGENLAGRDRAPALAGNNFIAAWAGRDAAALFDRIKATMPQSEPGSLSDESYAAIIAYMLNANGSSVTQSLDRRSMQGIAIAR
jgi:outer membrane protein assembly factor BamB/cytochrome c5